MKEGGATREFYLNDLVTHIVSDEAIEANILSLWDCHALHVSVLIPLLLWWLISSPFCSLIGSCSLLSVELSYRIHFSYSNTLTYARHLQFAISCPLILCQDKGVWPQQASFVLRTHLHNLKGPHLKSSIILCEKSIGNLLIGFVSVAPSSWCGEDSCSCALLWRTVPDYTRQ